MNKRGTRALTSVIDLNFCPKSKRSQLTIFIIIAVVIVALAAFIFLIYPKIITPSVVSKSPTEFIQDCMQEEIEDVVETISLQGGSLEPEFYTEYYGINIEYLCYTNEYYKLCVMQQPMLKQHIESEIKTAIREKSENCFNSLQENYRKKGYNVNLRKNDYDVELLPGKITTTFDYELTLEKGSIDRYDNFKVSLNNNLNELILVTNNILNNWEAKYGDCEITNYMDYYSWLKAEKRMKTDGTTIYILTDRDSGNKFQFASRSVAWP